MQVRQPVVEAEVLHFVVPGPFVREPRASAPLDAVVSEARHPVKKLLAVGQDRAALGSGDGLYGVEARGSEVRQASDKATSICRAKRVRGVGNDEQPAAPGPA